MDCGVEQNEGSWPDGQYLTPEITPGGVGLFDYDQDGDVDIYLVRHAPPEPMPGAFQAPSPNRLYRQEEDGRFVEVGQSAGIADAGYGHGCAIADTDNDGDLDVYVTNYGPDAYYENNGDGTFSVATEQAGITGDDWSSAASFFDYDRDGDLDLFVLHFAIFDAALKCKSSGASSEPEYCGPHTFPGVRDTLYRNNGDGTFEDVSELAGISVPARGWGVLCADLTDDGWPDVYVANDEEPNQLWVNTQDGTFVDEALIRGAALNGAGRVEASMGIALGDLNGDRRMEVFMTHISSETNTLIVRETGGGEMFADRSAASGMSAVDLQYTGWGCGYLDYDHDGDLDIAVANGRVARGPLNPLAHLTPFWNRYAEPNLLFENTGDLHFRSVGDEAGAFTRNPEVTRALAFGDLDNDGDIDLVTVNVDNSLRVFRNDHDKANTHWLGVRALVGPRDAIGATITVTAGEQSISRIVQPSYSYLASNDPRAHFGLGAHASIDAVEVVWPDGSRERFAGPDVDQYVIFSQGQGTPAE